MYLFLSEDRGLPKKFHAPNSTEINCVSTIERKSCMTELLW
jgi:hypothetical protein